MAEVLVLAELNPAGGGVRKTTLEALTAARALGEPSAVVIAAPGTAAGVKDALAEYGAATVYVAESPEVDDYLVAPKAEVLAQLVAEKSPAAVVIPSSPEGKEIAARLAVKTGSGFLTDVTEIAADGTATQVAFAGAVIVHSQVTAGTPIYTLRGNSVTPEPAPAAGAEEPVAVSLSDAAKQARVVDRVVEQKSSRPELTEASIVVSGGRGVGQRRELRRSSRHWPTRSARPSAPRAPRSTPASTRTASRWGRPARPSRRSSTSPSASPAPSSTAPACRPRRPSWPSTRTPRPRSSSWPTSASSAT